MFYRGGHNLFVQVSFSQFRALAETRLAVLVLGMLCLDMSCVRARVRCPLLQKNLTTPTSECPLLAIVSPDVTWLPSARRTMKVLVIGERILEPCVGNVTPTI